MKKRCLLLFVVLLLVWSSASVFGDEEFIPPKKQTVLGLYMTAAEAYEFYMANPNTVHVLDVRTPGEYIFVGHAPMAVNIPVQMLDKCVTPCGLAIMPPNPTFITEVQAKFNLNDTILVMCRSGGRSARAINMLAQVGFTDLINITDGFEGELDADGKRTINGWKNSDAPWTYNLDSSLICTP